MDYSAEFFSATAAGNTRVATTVKKLVDVFKPKNGKEPISVIRASVASLKGEKAAYARALFVVAVAQGATLPASVSEEDAQKIADERKRIDGRSVKSLSVVIRGTQLYAWHNSYVPVVSEDTLSGCKTVAELLTKLGRTGATVIQYDITGPEAEILAPLAHAKSFSRMIGNMNFVAIPENSRLTLGKPGKPAASSKPASTKKPASKLGNQAPAIEDDEDDDVKPVPATIVKAIQDAVKVLRSKVPEYPFLMAVKGEGLAAAKSELTDAQLLIAAIVLQKNPKGFMMVLEKRIGKMRFARLQKFIDAIAQAKLTGISNGQRRTAPDIRLSVELSKGFKITF